MRAINNMVLNWGEGGNVHIIIFSLIRELMINTTELIMNCSFIQGKLKTKKNKNSKEAQIILLVKPVDEYQW